MVQVSSVGTFLNHDKLGPTRWATGSSRWSWCPVSGDTCGPADDERPHHAGPDGGGLHSIEQCVAPTVMDKVCDPIPGISLSKEFRCS